MIKVVPHPHHFLADPATVWECMNPFCTEPEGICWRPWTKCSPTIDEVRASRLSDIADQLKRVREAVLDLPDMLAIVESLQARLLERARRLRGES